MRVASSVSWYALVGLVAALNYAARFADDGGTDTSDALYQYSTAVGGAVFYAILLGVILLLARGLDRREVLALRQPRSWGSASSRAPGLNTHGENSSPSGSRRGRWRATPVRGSMK